MALTTGERRFLFSIVALVLAGILAVLLLYREKKVAVSALTSLSQPLAQRAGGRTIQLNLTKVAVIERVSGEPLYRPFSLKVDEEGNLYVIDFGDIHIKKISTRGDLLVRFGTARGSAPGEFRNPIDYDFDPDNNIWVCDSETSLISVFDRRGSLIQTIRVPVTPLRIKVIARDRCLLMLNGRPQLFAVFDTTGRELHSFGTFIENQIRNDIVLDGWLARVGREGFVYASLYAGILTGLSFEGELWSYYQAITPQPWPRTVVTADGGTYVDNEAPIVHRDVCTVGDTAFALSRFGVRNGEESILDAYAVRDGRYLYSLSIPQKARSAVVAGSYIYTLADTTITVWLR
jgi:hypothetical protein